jgi:hypothetical protein
MSSDIQQLAQNGSPAARPWQENQPEPARPRRPIPPKLYRISDIVQYSGVSRQTIHNYTTMGLITEARRTAGGHRLYDESVFAQLDLISDMKRGGRSLREIRRHLLGADATG